MIDWNKSLPQIIAAIIGSGLIVTAFSTINSFIIKPIVDISVNETGISLKNIGYTPATHLRLTIHQPGAKISYNTVYKNENMTVRNEDPSSVVAFLPRLTPGSSVSIRTSNFDSIVATYDQGSYVYRPPSFPSLFFFYYPTLPFYTFILIVLAFLSFAIALRRRRRSQSKWASDILTDIIKVQNELDGSDHNDDISGIVIRLHDWVPNAENERQIFSDYRDYQKIDDFYSAVKSRNSYLLQNQVSSDILSILNKDCVNKATTAYAGINWTKFHKLDLILLIPAIILGTSFMAIVVHFGFYTTTFTTWSYFSLQYPSVVSEEVEELVYYIIGINFMILGVILSFFIIRLTLKATQGVIVNNYGLPTVFRSYALWFFCFVIVGIIPPLFGVFIVRTSNDYGPSNLAYFIVEIGSMFFLIWVVWRHYIKHKVKPRRHFLFKKQV